MQRLAGAAVKALPAEYRLDPVPLVVLGNRRQAHDFPRLLRKHMAGEIVPRITPEGRLSCRRCMISTMAPASLSFSRL
jgi:hypothetical protein